MELAPLLATIQINLDVESFANHMKDIHDHILDELQKKNQSDK